MTRTNHPIIVFCSNLCRTSYLNVNFCCLTWMAATLGPVNPKLQWCIRCIISSDRLALARATGVRGFKSSLGIWVIQFTSFIAVYDRFVFFFLLPLKKSEYCKIPNTKQCLKPTNWNKTYFAYERKGQELLVILTAQLKKVIVNKSFKAKYTVGYGSGIFFLKMTWF